MDGDAPAESRIEDSMALRQYTYAGRPFGDDSFVAFLESGVVALPIPWLRSQLDEKMTVGTVPNNVF